MKKALILGNGPSLSELDFEYLKTREDIDTFACNRIDLIYDKTDWRPDYYFCFSWNLRADEWKEGLTKIVSCKRTKCFVASALISGPKHNNLVYVDHLYEHSRHKPIPQNLFEPDWCNLQVKSFSATVPMFQYCFSNKYTHIAIIGQDGYIHEKGKNHFDEFYGGEAGDFKKTNDRILRLHDIIDKHSRERKIKVNILTDNSIIKIHEKINIEDW